jgi:YhcH/YjgK/YiaL family protein
MILDKLEHADRYTVLHPLFAEAFEALRNTPLLQMSPGKIELRGTDLSVAVSRDHGKRKVDAFLEAHRTYIDIHYCLGGEEHIGWRGISTCTQPDSPYDPPRDFMTFTDPAETWIVLVPGSFAIFFPDDAHAPMVSNGLVHKAVMKVAVSPISG